MNTSQCTVTIDGDRCIYASGHGCDHYAPHDGLDHSDEIRVQVLHDNCDRLKAENATLRKVLTSVRRSLGIGIMGYPGPRISWNAVIQEIDVVLRGSGDA